MASSRGTPLCWQRRSLDQSIQNRHCLGSSLGWFSGACSPGNVLTSCTPFSQSAERLASSTLWLPYFANVCSVKLLRLHVYPFYSRESKKKVQIGCINSLLRFQFLHADGSTAHVACLWCASNTLKKKSQQNNGKHRRFPADITWMPCALCSCLIS